MTEHEYEDWFAKYLGDVESLDSLDNNSCLQNIPKPFKRKKWIITNVICLAFTLVLSLFFAFLFEKFDFWLYDWANTALQSIFFGLVISIFFFIFTNQRDRNIAFYSDVIPLLRKRYNDMYEAYFQYTFEIQISRQKDDMESVYEAWHINSNTCFVIIGFFQYLFEVLPFIPKSFSSAGISNEILDKLSKNILDLNNKVQTEYFKDKRIHHDILKKCESTLRTGSSLLSSLDSFILELEQQYFSMKYAKRKATKSEKEYQERVYGNHQ